jgi:hypothetical protein
MVMTNKEYEQLKEIEKNIVDSRFTSVSQYLQQKIELLKIRMAELENFECDGSLKERFEEHKQLSAFLLTNLSLLFEYHKEDQLRRDKNV